MSDGGRKRALLAVKVLKSSHKWSIQRSAVRCIASMRRRSSLGALSCDRGLGSGFHTDSVGGPCLDPIYRKGWNVAIWLSKSLNALSGDGSQSFRISLSPQCCVPG